MVKISEHGIYGSKSAQFEEQRYIGNIEYALFILYSMKLSLAFD